MPQNPPDPELKEIERALGDLVPRSTRLNRDQLMFQAGAMSKRGAQGRRWVWPAISAGLCALLAGESLFLATRPGPQVIERFVVAPNPPTGAVASANPRASQPIAGGRLQPGSREMAATAGEPRSIVSWSGGSDYQRFQELVLRFGLDAIPEPGAVATRSDGGGLPGGAEFTPAGALRSRELEQILKPGGPS